MPRKKLADGEITQVDRMVDIIRAKPGIRTPDLAAAVDVDAKQLCNALRAVIEAGVVVTCIVKRPGQKPVNEYRVSAAFSDTAPGTTWRQFVINKPTLGEKPYMPKPDIRATVRPADGHDHTPRGGVKAPAGGGLQKTPAAGGPDAYSARSTGAAAVVEPPQPVPKPAAACSDETGFDDEDDSDAANYDRAAKVVASRLANEPRAVFTASSDGIVTLHRRGETGITLNPSEAENLYELLAATRRFREAA